MKNQNVYFLQRVMKDLALEDLVDVMVTEKESIPPKANPFRHDAFHMGSEISRGWMIMHSGNCEGKPLEYIILVNTNTGQRLVLNLFPKEMVERELIGYFPEASLQGHSAMRTGIGPFYRPYPTANGAAIEWKELEDNYGLNDEVYVHFGDFFAKYGLVKKKEEFFKAVEKEFFSFTVSEVQYSEKMAQINDRKMQYAIEDIRRVEEENCNN